MTVLEGSNGKGLQSHNTLLSLVALSSNIVGYSCKHFSVNHANLQVSVCARLSSTVDCMKFAWRHRPQLQGKPGPQTRCNETESAMLRSMRCNRRDDRAGSRGKDVMGDKNEDEQLGPSSLRAKQAPKSDVVSWRSLNTSQDSVQS